MKISEKTINVLKSFSQLNNSILIRPGNVIATTTEVKNVMARARVEETFSNQFAIYDLSKFLGIVSLFNEPDFEFGEKQVKISSGRQYIMYTYADPSFVTAAPDREIELPTTDVEFSVTDTEVNRLLRSLAVLELKDFVITGDGQKVYMKANNSKDVSSDSFAIEVGTTDKTFNVYLKPEYFKLMNNDYNVKISSRGLLQFTAPDLTYWVAAESKSTF